MPHTIAVISREGDTTIAWRSNNPDEVEDAKRRFQYYLDKGYRAFRAGVGGEHGGRIAAGLGDQLVDPGAGRVHLLDQARHGSLPLGVPPYESV